MGAAGQHVEDMWQPSVAALKSLIKHNFDGARAAGLGNLLENFFGNFAASSAVLVDFSRLDNASGCYRDQQQKLGLCI